MTDHEHDPHVRMLADKTTAIGKSVVLIPEGVQTLSETSVRPYFENWFWDVSSLTRFAVSEQEASNFMGTFAVDQVIHTGYLGGSARINDEAIPFLATLTRLLLNRHRGSKPMVLVNFESPGVLGLSRAGQQDLYSELVGIENLIFALADLGWSVCITSKVSDSHGYLRSRFKGLPVWFFTHVSWQFLAKTCDTLIQRDSSLGPEALELNIPVLVWNECLLPLASSKCIETSKGMMKLVESTQQLESALAHALLVNRKRNRANGCRVAVSLDENLDRWLDSVSN